MDLKLIFFFQIYPRTRVIIIIPVPITTRVAIIVKKAIFVTQPASSIFLHIGFSSSDLSLQSFYHYKKYQYAYGKQYYRKKIVKIMQYSLHHHKPNLREYIFFGPCIEIEYLCHIAILVWISKNLQNWRNWAKMIHQENIHNFLHHFHQHSQMYLQFMTGLRTKIKIITNLAFISKMANFS